MMALAGSRRGGYGTGPKKPAKYKCTKCGWAYEEPEAGGTVCPECGCKYVQWVNPTEFIELGIRQDAILAKRAEAALEDAGRAAKAAIAQAKKKKRQQKNASKTRKRNRK